MTDFEMIDERLREIQSMLIGSGGTEPLTREATGAVASPARETPLPVPSHSSSRFAAPVRAAMPGGPVEPVEPSYPDALNTPSPSELAERAVLGPAEARARALVATAELDAARIVQEARSEVQELRRQIDELVLLRDRLAQSVAEHQQVLAAAASAHVSPLHDAPTAPQTWPVPPAHEAPDPPADVAPPLPAAEAARPAYPDAPGTTPAFLEAASRLPGATAAAAAAAGYRFATPVHDPVPAPAGPAAVPGHPAHGGSPAHTAVAQPAAGHAAVGDQLTGHPAPAVGSPGVDPAQPPVAPPFVTTSPAATPTQAWSTATTGWTPPVAGAHLDEPPASPVPAPAPARPSAPVRPGAFGSEGGVATLIVGHFEDVAAIEQFERQLLRVAVLDDVYLRAYDSGRAIFELTMAHPVGLASEIQAIVPIGVINETPGALVGTLPEAER